MRMRDGREFRSGVVVSDAGAANTFDRLLPADLLRSTQSAVICAPFSPPPRMPACMLAFRGAATSWDCKAQTFGSIHPSITMRT